MGNRPDSSQHYFIVDVLRLEMVNAALMEGAALSYSGELAHVLSFSYHVEWAVAGEQRKRAHLHGRGVLFL